MLNNEMKHVMKIIGRWAYLMESITHCYFYSIVYLENSFGEKTGDIRDSFSINYNYIYRQ